ncbi:MAG: lipopolysaccharide biosynthesis protein [Eubacteriales bacterium]|nr:lipopolysaccharide biosynthesis protein [Eubacteriales bacterium]
MTGRIHLKSGEKRGAVWSAVGNTMYALTSVIFLIVINRTGEISTTGSFSLAYTVAQLLLYIGIFGVSALQITDYAERYSFADYFWFRMVTTAGMLLFGVAAGLVLGAENDKFLYTVLLTAFMAVNSFADLYQCRFLQLTRLDLNGKALFFRMLLSSAAFTLILLLTKSVTSGLLGMLFVNAAATAFWCVRVNHALTTREYGFSRSRFALLLRDSLPLCVGLFLINFIIGCPKYGIDYFLSDAEQGYYNLIFMPAAVINLFSQFVFLPLLNRFSAALNSPDTSVFRELFIKSLLFLLALTLIAAFGAYLLGPAVFGFFYGTDLSAYRMEMFVVMLGGGLFALYQLYYYVFVILKKQKTILRNLSICALAAVPLACGLIPWKGILGACLTYMVSLLLLAAEFAVSFKRNRRETPARG